MGRFPEGTLLWRPNVSGTPKRESTRKGLVPIDAGAATP
jgi:hypothetical protein